MTNYKIVKANAKFKLRPETINISSVVYIIYIN